MSHNPKGREAPDGTDERAVAHWVIDCLFDNAEVDGRAVVCNEVLTSCLDRRENRYEAVPNGGSTVTFKLDPPARDR